MTGERKLIDYLQEHLRLLSDRVGLSQRTGTPIRAYLAGGFAVNYWTGDRMSDDVDIKWSHRIPIPPDMQIFEVPSSSSNNESFIVTFDGSFNDTLGSFPPEWEAASKKIGEFGAIELHVINPLDLAVSKVGRFQDNDKNDIKLLAELHRFTPDEFEQRCREALDYYVGNATFVVHNARDAKEIVERAQYGFSATSKR